MKKIIGFGKRRDTDNENQINSRNNNKKVSNHIIGGLTRGLRSEQKKMR